MQCTVSPAQPSLQTPGRSGCSQRPSFEETELGSHLAARSNQYVIPGKARFQARHEPGGLPRPASQSPHSHHLLLDTPFTVRTALGTPQEMAEHPTKSWCLTTCSLRPGFCLSVSVSLPAPRAAIWRGRVAQQAERKSVPQSQGTTPPHLCRADRIPHTLRRWQEHPLGRARLLIHRV